MEGSNCGLVARAKFIVLLVLILFVGSYAFADTMNFESVTPYVFISYGSFSENGLTLWSDAMWIVGPANMQCGPGCVNNGTNVDVVYRAWLTTGSVFNLNSVDYSQSFPGGYDTLYITGDIQGGGTYSTTLNLDLANGFQTATLNWTNLTSVFFEGSGGLGHQWSYFTIDNIDVDATPEPATLVLLGAGLLGVGSITRRRLHR